MAPHQARGPIPDPLDAYCAIYDAFNEGLKRAEGELVGMIHVCDRFASTSVIADAAQTLAATKAHAVYGDLAYIAGHHSDQPLRYWHSGHISPENIACGWTPPLASLIARRDAFERLRADNGMYFATTPYPDPWRLAFLAMTVGMGMRLAYVPKVWLQIPIYSPTNQVMARMIGCQDL
jgi:glycosyltransferase